MKGVASTSRIITFMMGKTHPHPVQHLNWVAMVGWAAVTVSGILNAAEEMDARAWPGRQARPSWSWESH